MITAGAVWLATFLSHATIAQADQRYLVRAEFSEYVQAQTQQSVKSELRMLEQEIVKIKGELQYGNLTPERKAQLEQQLQLLETQKADTERDLAQ